MANSSETSAALREQTERLRDGALLYDRDGLLLAAREDRLFFCDGTRVFELSSSGYEPCTCLMRDGRVHTCIHNAFNVDEIRALAEHGGVLRAISGTEYDLGKLCRMLALAADYADCGLDLVEGRLAVETLKALGALSPAQAVYPYRTGLRRIPHTVTHSKRLKERVMFTQDGRVYVRIKA